jgi:hypothetical protein
MGRPIRKVYFNGDGSSSIGGESVASIAVGGTNNAYTVLPALSIAAPGLPGGANAIARAHMAVVGITNFLAGTSGYAPGQVLTLAGGTGTQGTITVSTTKVASVTVVAGGDGYAVNDVVTLVGGTSTAAATFTVTAISGGGGTGPVTALTVDGVGGSYSVNPTLVGAATTPVAPGIGADLTVTVTMNVDTVALTTGGDYTALPADVTRVGHTGGGTGADFNLTYKVLSAEVTTAGSGYAATPALTETPNGNATFVLTMSATGANVIAPTANVTGVGGKLGDVVKQASSRGYIVTTADGTGRCTLVAAAPGQGQVNIFAKDSAGGLYYVTKLTARRATIVKGDQTGVQFTTGADGISVPWIFAPATAVENVSVEIVSN